MQQWLHRHLVILCETEVYRTVIEIICCIPLICRHMLVATQSVYADIFISLLQRVLPRKSIGSSMVDDNVTRYWQHCYCFQISPSVFWYMWMLVHFHYDKKKIILHRCMPIWQPRHQRQRSCKVSSHSLAWMQLHQEQPVTNAPTVAAMWAALLLHSSMVVASCS